MNRIFLILILFFLNGICAAQGLNDKWQGRIDEGKVLYQNGQYKSALDQFMAAKELIPTDTIAYTYCADCAYKTNDPEIVYEILRQADVVEFKTVKLYTLAVSAARDLERNPGRAIGLADKGLIDFPNNFQLLFERAMVDYESGNYETSSTQLRNIINIYPNEVTTYFQLFHNLLEKENKMDEAASLLKIAIQKFPENADLKKLEPDIYLREGNLEKAANVLKALTNQYSSDPKLFYNLALVYYNLGNFELSVEMSNRALLINPDYYDALYNLGSFFYYMGLQNNLALSEMSVLQYVHNNQGRNMEKAAYDYFEMARPYFERALKLKPEELDAYENLSTIDVLIANLSNMINEEIPQTQMVQPEKVVNSDRPLLFINELQFNYPNQTNALNKGEKGLIHFTVTNRGNKIGEQLKVVVFQPVVVPGLLFDKETVIHNVAPGENLEVEIPVTFIENDATTKGIEKFDLGAKKLRIYVQEKDGNNADLVEFEVNLKDAPEFDEKVLVSGTEDIMFVPNPKPRNYLLLLAVDDYEFWPDLVNPEKDINSIKDVLVGKYNFNSSYIFELYNKDFTHENLRNELIKIKNEISPIDNLIIYYAGHGSYDREFDLGAWIPYNAELGNDVDYIQNSSLLKYLDGISAKHILMLIDACFSGSLFQGGNVSYADTPDENLSSRWALSSGNLEVVSDGVDGAHSPFAHSLIELLSENKGNDLAVRDIISYVSLKVRNQSDQSPVGKPLNSKFHQGGEFVFHPKR
ncbi:MAG: tetratricopeptide repeat protein [Prolixibacteraceae bacterium]